MLVLLSIWNNYSFFFTTCVFCKKTLDPHHLAKVIIKNVIMFNVILIKCPCTSCVTQSSSSTSSHRYDGVSLRWRLAPRCWLHHVAVNLNHSSRTGKSTRFVYINPKLKKMSPPVLVRGKWDLLVTRVTAKWTQEKRKNLGDSGEDLRNWYSQRGKRCQVF